MSRPCGIHPAFSIPSADARGGYSERAPPKCSKISLSWYMHHPNPFTEILPKLPPIRKVADLAFHYYPSSSVLSFDVVPNPHPICFRPLLRFISELSPECFRARGRVKLHPHAFKKLKYQHCFEGFPVDARHPRLRHHQLGGVIALQHYKLFSATHLQNLPLYENQQPAPQTPWANTWRKRQTHKINTLPARLKSRSPPPTALPLQVVTLRSLPRSPRPTPLLPAR